MTSSVIIAILGVLVQCCIAYWWVKKSIKLHDETGNLLDESIRHEKLAIDILHFSQELLETTCDEERVNLIIKYHQALTEVHEIERLTDKYNK